MHFQYAWEACALETQAGKQVGNMLHQSKWQHHSLSITSQTHQLPEESLDKSAQQTAKSQRAEELKDIVERIRESAPPKTKGSWKLRVDAGRIIGKRDWKGVKAVKGEKIVVLPLMHALKF